jgi:hypothetical protein
MKKAILLIALLLPLVLFAGCNLGNNEPKRFVKDTRPGLNMYGARARVHRTIMDNGQMAWDDFDHFWMIDRPSTLNWLRTSRYGSPR